MIIDISATPPVISELETLVSHIKVIAPKAIIAKARRYAPKISLRLNFQLGLPVLGLLLSNINSASMALPANRFSFCVSKICPSY